MLRVIVFVILCFAALFVNSTFETLIDPTVSGIVAANQVENSEEAAVAVRAYTAFTNAVPLYTWGTVLVIGLVMFYRDLKNLVR